MLFTDASFLLYFLPFALITHRIAVAFGKAGEYHNIAKLTFFTLTLLFYGYMEPWWLIPYLVGVGFDFLWASILGKTQRPSCRRVLLLLSIVQNLCLLGLFKYWGTWVSLVEAHHPEWAGILPRLESQGILLSLPAGISFYTFESMSFVIDVYRGHVSPPKNPLDFFGFIGMFPRFIAGPIVRYPFLARQFKAFKGMQLERGLYLFALGLFFKICFADHFSVFVRYAYDRTGTIEFMSAWVGAFAYAMQLYFDFFGYSLMAIGLGRCFGFEFPDNFNRPFLAHTIQNFWTRWHITLSLWLRDYYYFPVAMALARRSRYLIFLAPLTTMMLIGIWHGPRLTYFLMGVWFGLWICLEEIVGFGRNWPKSVGRYYTLCVVLIGWVGLRAKDIDEGARVIRAMFHPFGQALRFNTELLIANPIAAVFCLAGIVYCFWIEPRADLTGLSIGRGIVRTPVALSMIILALIFAYSEQMIPFLYFDF